MGLVIYSGFVPRLRFSFLLGCRPCGLWTCDRVESSSLSHDTLELDSIQRASEVNYSRSFSAFLMSVESMACLFFGADMTRKKRGVQTAAAGGGGWWRSEGLPQETLLPSRDVVSSWPAGCSA